jgi:hypothetical protein
MGYYYNYFCVHSFQDGKIVLRLRSAFRRRHIADATSDASSSTRVPLQSLHHQSLVMKDRSCDLFAQRAEPVRNDRAVIALK